MPEPKLEPPRIMAGIGEEMAAGVPKGMRVNVGEPGALASALDHLGDVTSGHWPAAFRGEYECGRGFLLAAKLPQGPQFVALDRMHAIDPTLEPLDVQMALGEVHLIPLQVNGLSDAQAVTGHEQDQRGIPLPMSAELGSLD